MLEKPNLQDKKIIICLKESYGIDVSSLEFLPVGNDSSAWVYRLTADNGTEYFLKVKRGKINPASALVPNYLKEQGIEQVVETLPTIDHLPWQSLDEFTVLLYPFIYGPSGMEAGLKDVQWIEYGRFLKQLHTSQLPDHLLGQLQKETFIPMWSKIIRKLKGLIKRNSFNHHSEKELTEFWNEKEFEIENIVDRAEELGKKLKSEDQGFVLCHADIHTANILLTPEGKIHVVDWDGVILAPKERDLMFMVGTRSGGTLSETREEGLFFQGYGKTHIDLLPMAYYRYEWVVQEIGDFGERVFLLPDVGDKTKEDSLRGFKQLFQPGDVVEAAYYSDWELKAAGSKF